MRIIASIFGALFFLGIVAAAGGLYLLTRYTQDLPDYSQLAEYEPPVVTRVHAGDGRLLSEFATERRVFVPIQAIPQRVRQAFISAEDQNFYSHPGVDPRAVVRAAVSNLQALGSGRRPEGASTITQQVAKNFLLSSDVSFERKIKEALLAFRMEQAFEKDQILELYLNEIYLGGGSYGVAAAALNYFNKSLDELTLEEAAYLAALPKAPNNYHPVRNHDLAMARRNWVLGRMRDDGFITPEEAREAQARPLEMHRREDADVVRADFFAEEVRREIQRAFGSEALYGGGLSVRATVDPDLQNMATRALQQGLITYDRRHGWRGPIATVETGDDWAETWQEAFAEVVAPPSAAPGWQMAVVIEVGANSARVGLGDGTEGRIPMAEMTWARPWLSGQRVGNAPNSPSDVVSAGDVVLVEATGEVAEAELPLFALRQVPDVNGALVALDPHTGRVLAMAGGFSFEQSEFNRVTQARRQPGSSFKPFVYLTALEEGYEPSTVILDAPFVLDQGPGLGRWKPTNYSGRFYGPTAMRTGIEQSRNLMTVRLAQSVGMDRIADLSERFGIYDNLSPQLSMSLGAGETTLLRLASAYGMLVNGGKRIEPAIIDRIQDRHGRTIYRHDERPCEGCLSVAWNGQGVPEIPDERERVTDPASAYQIVSMLEGVVQRGTGQRLNALGKPIAGKTGTTNEARDVWFLGMTPDLVVGAYVGFDEPRGLGPRETGSSVALPIVERVFTEYLEDRPGVPFRIPPGVRMVRMDLDTGRPATSDSRRVILEAFKSSDNPEGRQRVLDGGQDEDDDSYAEGGDSRSQPRRPPPSSSQSPATGGLY